MCIIYSILYTVIVMIIDNIILIYKLWPINIYNPSSIKHCIFLEHLSYRLYMYVTLHNIYIYMYIYYIYIYYIYHIYIYIHINGVLVSIQPVSFNPLICIVFQSGPSRICRSYFTPWPARLRAIVIWWLISISPIEMAMGWYGFLQNCRDIPQFKAVMRSYINQENLGFTVYPVDPTCGRQIPLVWWSSPHFFSWSVLYFPA